MLIQVDGLSKSFEYYRKELGVKNSLKNLFYREKLIKEAVREISPPLDTAGDLGRADTTTTTEAMRITTLMEILRSFL